MLVLRACHSPWGTAWLRVDLPSARISLWQFYPSLLFVKGLTDTGCLLLGTGNLLRNCKSEWNEFRSQPDSLHLLNRSFPEMLAFFFFLLKGENVKCFLKEKLGECVCVCVFLYRVTVHMVCLLNVSQGVVSRRKGQFLTGRSFPSPISHNSGK